MMAGGRRIRRGNIVDFPASDVPPLFRKAMIRALDAIVAEDGIGELPDNITQLNSIPKGKKSSYNGEETYHEPGE